MNLMIYFSCLVLIPLAIGMAIGVATLVVSGIIEDILS